MKLFSVIAIGTLFTILVCFAGYYTGKRTAKLKDKGQYNVRIVLWFILVVTFGINIYREGSGFALIQILNEAGFLFSLFFMVSSIVSKIKNT